MSSNDIDILASDIIDAVTARNYGYARKLVRAVAGQDRAHYLPAGARDNLNAVVLVDGVQVGQASVLMHLCRIDPITSMFGPNLLRPAE